jgi:hypothetical protein
MGIDDELDVRSNLDMSDMQALYNDDRGNISFAVTPG